MSDVRAAAERIRRVRAGEGLMAVYCGHGDMPGRELDKWILDRAVVADAWLDEYPTDDDEPVTKEWLRAVGFLPDGDDSTDDLAVKIWERGQTEDYGEGPAMHFLQSVRDGGSSWLEAYTAGGKTLCLIEIDPRRTRGDVRRLCAALGVNLKG